MGIPGGVQLGCGLTTKGIRGRPYLYFWHYEERAGRRQDKEKAMEQMRKLGYM